MSALPEHRGRALSCAFPLQLLILVCPAWQRPLPAQGPDLLVKTRAGQVASVTQLHLDGERLRGRSLGKSWSLPFRKLWLIEPQRDRQAQAKDRALARKQAVLQAAQPFVQLRQGPRLAARFIGSAPAGNSAEASTDRLQLRFKMGLGGIEATVPLRHVQAIRFAAAAKPSRPAPGPGHAKGGAAGTAQAKSLLPSDAGFLQACAEAPRDRDLLFVRVKGKLRRVPCRLKGFDKNALVVTRGSIPLNQVYGLVLGETSGVEAEPLQGAGRILLRCMDGRELRGRLVTLDDQRVVFDLAEGLRLAIGWAQIRDLEVESERLLYLSSLPLAPQSRAVPALGRSWPVLRDHAPAATELRLGKTVFRRGFFVVPPRSMVFDLPRSFERFEARVGMPAARFGSARLRFYAGEHALGDALELEANGLVHELSLPLGGARRLRIVIEASRDLDSGSRVIFGDLRVVSD